MSSHDHESNRNPNPNEPLRALPDENQRRQFLSAALVGAAGGAALNAWGATTSASAVEPAGSLITPTRQALHPPGAPAADSGYSPAIMAQGQRLLFISGQGPEDIHADMEVQIRQTFDRIGILLQAAGATFANVVIVRSYWVYMLRDIAIFRKVRKDYLVEPYPASTAVGTPELAIPGLELEIEVVAVL
ncbi:MAG: Rid family hydrolase [Planctomycetota bacterium]|nr:Rid family hydrolase [Planctomycetota bacterium]MDA1178503.1 Rid family hydrolase [Planctomycetota bacterium]